MPLLSNLAKIKKINFFIKTIPKNNNILEIGSGDGWLKKYLVGNGWKNYVGIDTKPPSDIIGDIKNWEGLGLKNESFDIIIAFEVIEHIDCLKECYNLLKNNGLLMITSPVPYFDWICKLLELIGLNQKRTSTHKCVYFSKIPYFKPIKIKNVGFLAQWGIFKK